MLFENNQQLHKEQRLTDIALESTRKLKIINASINPELSYLCTYTFKQEKLTLTPTYRNGRPLIFHKLLINDLKQTNLRIYLTNLELQGFKIVEKIGMLTFIKIFQGQTDSEENINTPFDNSFEQVLIEINKLVQRILSAMNPSKLKKKIHNPKNQKYKEQSQRHALELSIRKKINLIKSRTSSKQSVDETPSFDFSRPLSNIIDLKNIQVNDKVSSQRIIGGVSIVQKVEVKSTTEWGESSKILIRKLIKMPKIVQQKSQSNPKRDMMLRNTIYRFSRELEIVKHLKNQSQNQYLVNYYYNQEEFVQDNKAYYLDCIDMSLTQFIYLNRETLGYRERFHICKEIVNLVIKLHKSGVVHRDLKPDNILVDKSEPGKFSLKLIDFSDSFIFSKENGQKIQEDKMIYGTIPYSPIQTQKSNANYRSQGIDKKQIDNWSVGMLLHVVMYGYNPISFSNCFWKQINNLWKNEFLYRLQKIGHNINFLNQQLKLLIVHLLQVDQNKRLDLEKCSEILHILVEYYQNLLQSD